jgi:hypothetical protein
MIWLLQLLILLIADVTIAPEHRVPNRTNQQCVWASIETQARYWGITRLYHLTRDYDGPSDPALGLAVLWWHGVDCYWSPRGEHNWSLLERLAARRWPVAVAVEEDEWRHMFLVIDVTKTTVTTLDNDVEFTVAQWPRDRFNQIWNGWQIAIFKEN